MRLFTMICVCAAFALKVYPQMQPQSVKTSTAAVGLSAISVNTIVAKEFHLTYPVFDYKADSLSKQLFFSTRQKGDASGSLYFSRGFCAAITTGNDSVKWLNESSLYHIRISGNSLFFSNELKSVKYNKTHGYDELRYESKLIHTWPKYNRGLMYSRTQLNELQCINLSLGTITWSCTVPSGEDWVDVQPLNDSVLVIAAGGLHAVHVRRGLLWSFPLGTSVKTNRSFIYSNAKYLTIQKISTVIKTSGEENLVTQIASNILKGKDLVYFASKEKMIAVSHSGKLAWQLDLKNYPASKMYISKTDSSLILANFGLATHSNNFITWGKPFILTIDPASGRILTQFDLSHIENLADFVRTDKSLIFASKDGIQEAKPGNTDLKTVMQLGPSYGEFVEFINGDEYYIFKEGYFVPLNFINDNLIYFKADNNKIYGLAGEDVQYEYHFTELYKLDKKYQDKTILVNPEKTLITSQNFELLFTINLAEKNVILNDKMYFIGEFKISSVDLKNLK